MIPVKYEGKGILVPIFLIISIVATLLLYKSIENYLQTLLGVTIDYQYILGIGVIIAGIWTSYAKDTYIIKDGKKEVLEDVENSFFFIRMKYWADIFYVTGICIIVDGLIF